MDFPFDLDVTDRLLTTTPSVRRKLDLDRPVESQVIEDCLRIALQAPTPANSQKWRWIVVRDQAVRNRLGGIFRAQGNAYLDGGRASLGDAVNTPSIARIFASGQHLIDVIERVPVLVIPCLDGRPEKEQSQSAFYGGIFPAVWSFQLALRSRGLGSTLTTFHLANADSTAESAEILGIPDDVTQICLLPVAYTTTTNFRPSPRLPVKDVAFTDRWGTPFSG